MNSTELRQVSNEASLNDLTIPARSEPPTISTLEFCGKNLNVPEIAFAILADNWESTMILTAVTKDNTSLTLSSDEGYRAALRNYTESEYDAEHMCQYLEARMLEGSLDLSPEFVKFEKAWRRDEMNHALGFAMIESLIYGRPVEETFGELRERRPNFRPLEDLGLLTDEFSTCLLLAYDEISTARSSWEDRKSVYPKFENPALIEWITKVAADESHHFQNLVRIIKKNHADRIPQIPDLLNRILEWERSPHQYEATFVLDHTGPQFNTAFLDKSVTIFLRQFGMDPEALENS